MTRLRKISADKVSFKVGTEEKSNRRWQLKKLKLVGERNIRKNNSFRCAQKWMCVIHKSSELVIAQVIDKVEGYNELSHKQTR
jgi:ribosomal protein L18